LADCPVSPWRLPHLTPPIVRIFMLRRNTIRPRLTPLDAPRRQSIRVYLAVEFMSEMGGQNRRSDPH
jgi:hypothetical protein